MSDDNENVRRTLAMIETALEDAFNQPLFPMDVEAMCKQVDGYLDTLRSRRSLSSVTFENVTTEADIAAGQMMINVSGPLSEMWPFLLKGRDTLPFPVPQEVPADMDPRIVAAMDELNAYYDDNMAWGSLHIVLDDGNVSDADVDFCLANAKERGDLEGASIARLLQAVTPDQRMMLHQWWYGSGPFREVRA